MRWVRPPLPSTGSDRIPGATGTGSTGTTGATGSTGQRVRQADRPDRTHWSKGQRGATGPDRLAGKKHKGDPVTKVGKGEKVKVGKVTLVKAGARARFTGR